MAVTGLSDVACFPSPVTKKEDGKGTTSIDIYNIMIATLFVVQ
jgi:hypothetical protein